VRIEILEDAERELDEAIAYYEKIEPGLGIRLKAEARGLSNGFFSPGTAAAQNQRISPGQSEGLPLLHAYFVWSETVWIVATAHSKRRPEYWIRRKSHIPDL